MEIVCPMQPETDKPDWKWPVGSHRGGYIPSRYRAPLNYCGAAGCDSTSACSYCRSVYGSLCSQLPPRSITSKLGCLFVPSPLEQGVVQLLRTQGPTSTYTIFGGMVFLSQSCPNGPNSNIVQWPHCDHCYHNHALHRATA